MRFCHNCRQWNNEWPTRCRHCGVGLDGRLCPRHHVNPVDPRLSFCGECGQPLERKWGAGFSFVPYVVALSIFIGTMLLCALATLFLKEDPVMSSFVCLVILVIGLRVVFQILPPWVKNATSAVAHFFLRVVLGTGNKG